MTRSTSAVAVCCSKASRVSVISRVFSIAITAWSAKVRTSSICRSVNGSTRWRASVDHADRLAFAQQRHAERRSHFADRHRLRRRAYSGSARDIGDMHRLRRSSSGSPGNGAAAGL